MLMDYYLRDVTLNSVVDIRAKSIFPFGKIFKSNLIL